MRARAKELIDWSKGLSVDATQLILDKIKDNAAKGIGSFGKAYTGKRGQKIDWKESGHMLNDAKCYVGGKISFAGDYASFVNARYSFADGFSDEDKKELATQIKPLMAKALNQNKG